MFEAMVQGFTALDVSVLGFVLLGVAFGQFVAVVPGLGGPFSLAMLLPLVYGMDPIAAISMLVAAAVTSGTGNSATTILLGLPGSSQGVASLFDGYPMARKGQGGRALAAALTASLVGGVFGALLLGVAIPFARPIVLALGPAEFFVLVLGALIFMSRVVQGDWLKSIIALGLGLAISLVGIEQSTAVRRYTLGSTYLWDGVMLVPAVIGLYALAEMAWLTVSGMPIAGEGGRQAQKGQVAEGIKDVFRHWKVTLQSSLIGVFVGLVPGLGGATPGLLAYSKAAAGAKNRKDFGTGVVEGVIAADAPTNSKDGGALVVTLAFGIPGSASMALLLAAFVTFGIEPGIGMITENLSLTWTIIWVLVIANILATGLMLGATGWVSKITLLRPSLIVAPVTVFSLFGAYVARGVLGDVIVTIAFGFIGFALSVAGYSRIMLLIGLVLGPLLEKNLLLTSGLYGWQVFTRPFTLIFGAVLVVGLVVPALRQRSSKRDVGPGAPMAGNDEGAQDAPDSQQLSGNDL